MADTLEQLLKIADRFREDLTQEEQEMIRLIREKGVEQSAPPQTFGDRVMESAKIHGFVRITPTLIIHQSNGTNLNGLSIRRFMDHIAFGEGGIYRLFPVLTPHELVTFLEVDEEEEAYEWADQETGHFIIPPGLDTKTKEDRALCFFDEKTPGPDGLTPWRSLVTQ